ncbi:MAG: peptidoglycan-binding domain-containing protein [Gemmobacter sp.]
MAPQQQDANAASGMRLAPPPASAAGCWQDIVQPALFETVTEQVIVVPERRNASGAIVSADVVLSDVRQRQVRPRRTVWVPVPCPGEGTEDPAFVATLQRALKARGMFDGPVTGRYDAATAEAVRRVQRPLGLDSDVLTLGTARSLGLVPSRG